MVCACFGWTAAGAGGSAGSADFVYCVRVPRVLRMDFVYCVFNFLGTKGRMDVGLRVLWASGWRPDCAVDDVSNVTRLVPPPRQRYRPIVVGASCGNVGVSIEEQHWIDGITSDPDRDLLVQVATRRFVKWCATVSYVRAPGAQVDTQCIFHGTDEGEELPNR